MSKSYEIDLQLHWFCSGDLTFTHNDDMGCDISIHTVTGSNEAAVKVAPFVILKKGNLYRIGQLYDFEHDTQTDTYTDNGMRHTSLIKQNYHLPYSMPGNGIFLGPMHAINVMRIIRSVQAMLSGDHDVRDDALESLHSFYEEKEETEQKPSNIVRLAFA